MLTITLTVVEGGKAKSATVVTTKDVLDRLLSGAEVGLDGAPEELPHVEDAWALRRALEGTLWSPTSPLAR